MYKPGGTIEQALTQIGKNNYVLPAIQREFVWRPEQIERLFDSLMQGYPFGTFLFWSVEPQNAGKFKFYDFVRHYHERTGAHCPDLDDMKGRAVTAVLDGQQRLTALNIGLRGSMSWRLKHKRRDNPQAYPRRYLYLDLLGAAPDDEAGSVYRFKFLEKEVAEEDTEAFWFAVPEVLDLDGGSDILEVIEERDLDKDDRKKAYDTLDQLRRVVRSQQTISYYEEDSQDLERVLNIFIRLNSGGTVLSYSDLLLSIAVAQWKKIDARREIHELVDELNGIGAGFDFDHDFVLKAGLMLADIASVGFKVKNFTAENMAHLETQWASIRKALIMAVELVSSFGLSHANLRAESSLLPIAYYLHVSDPKKNYVTSVKSTDDREAIRFWLVRSLLKPSGIWGSGLDTLLNDLRDVIRKSGDDGFPAEELARFMSRRGKSLVFDDDEIEELLEMRYGDRRSFLLLSLLFPFVDLRNQFHMDHIYPISRFTPRKLAAAGVERGEVDDLRWIADTIPNLQLLEGPMNIEKKAKTPADWLNEAFPSKDGRRAYSDRHMLGEVPSQISDFEDFAEARSECFKERLTSLLKVMRD